MSKRLPKEEYRELVESVYERDQWRCVLCRKRTRLTPHHVLPRSQGGEDAAENLVTLCLACHETQAGGGWKKKQAYFQGWIEGRRRKAGNGPRLPKQGRKWTDL